MPSTPNTTCTGLVTVAPSFGATKKTRESARAAADATSSPANTAPVIHLFLNIVFSRWNQAGGQHTPDLQNRLTHSERLIRGRAPRQLRTRAPSRNPLKLRVLPDVVTKGQSVPKHSFEREFRERSDRIQKLGLPDLRLGL